MSGKVPWRVLSNAEAAAPPYRFLPPPRARRRWLVALAVSAVLSASLLTTVAIAAVSRQNNGPALPPLVATVLVETFDATPVDLRVGPHRFRIPRHYFRHPPNRIGVDDSFALRVLLPEMEPITEANRHVFRMPFSTEEGRRKTWVVYEHRADIPQDGARWRLGNAARSRVSGLEDFQAASDATHGLRALIGPPFSDKPWAYRLPDLYWGSLPGDGRFVGLSCSGAPPSEAATCTLLLDWSGRPLSTDFERRELARWREIAAASIALINRLSITGEDADSAAR